MIDALNQHDTGTNVTALDSIEKSIAAMRTGPALASPNLFVAHPSTWSALRRIKDTQGRFLTAADPTADEASSIWGVPTIVTTQLATGTGVLLDTSKLGRVYARESLLLLHMGFSGDDFTRNIVRFVAEERIGLAVERPAAVLSLTGLPTS